MVIVAPGASLPANREKKIWLVLLWLVSLGRRGNPLEVANDLLLVLRILVRRTRHVPVAERRLGGQAGRLYLVVVVVFRVVELLLVLGVIVPARRRKLIKTISL